MKSLTFALWIVLVSLIGFGTFKTASGVAVAVQFNENVQPDGNSGRPIP